MNDENELLSRSLVGKLSGDTRFNSESMPSTPRSDKGNNNSNNNFSADKKLELLFRESVSKFS